MTERFQEASRAVDAAFAEFMAAHSAYVGLPFAATQAEIDAVNERFVSAAEAYAQARLDQDEAAQVLAEAQGMDWAPAPDELASGADA